MDSTSEPVTIFSSPDFMHAHRMWMTEFTDMKIQSCSLEQQAFEYPILDYEIIRHCRFGMNTKHDSFKVKIQIGKDVYPNPIDEIFFFLELKTKLGQNISGLESYLPQSVIGWHWSLDDYWRKIRKFCDDGLEIIEIVNKYFEHRKDREELPDYLKEYFQSQYINMPGTSESYFDFSPLLHTYQTKYLVGFPEFDHNKFTKEFHDLLKTKDLYDLVHFDFGQIPGSPAPSWNNSRYRRVIPNISETALWKLDSSLAGNYRVMAYEIIYLCLLKSEKKDWLNPLENLISVLEAKHWAF